MHPTVTLRRSCSVAQAMSALRSSRCPLVRLGPSGTPEGAEGAEGPCTHPAWLHLSLGLHCSPDISIPGQPHSAPPLCRLLTSSPPSHCGQILLSCRSTLALSWWRSEELPASLLNWDPLRPKYSHRPSASLNGAWLPY
ncbi:hypothetical protein NDU88_008035 [Pleurodeles waltl]|uniref:Uncharacterized protein n=1 Tax=Pleurodeles waltl TaxID=8319 RepID=A0AAV7QQN2_PLEWA|nr:hypothetical protein NDU88_008035 [Pleurodeles waltl]